MSFEVLTADILASGPQSAGFQIYVDPLPGPDRLPTVWLDLHVGEGGWQHCEEHDRWRPFQRSGNRHYTLIRPRHGIRLTTAERIGTGLQFTAIVVNVASQASRGLIVAPGKIDPGFNPNPLGVVVYNQSQRSVRLYRGEKIGALAFVRLPRAAPPTESHGYGFARPAAAVVEPVRLKRMTDWIRRRDWPGIWFDLFKILATALVSLGTLWMVWKLGWHP